MVLFTPLTDSALFPGPIETSLIPMKHMWIPWSDCDGRQIRITHWCHLAQYLGWKLQDVGSKTGQDSHGILCYNKKKLKYLPKNLPVPNDKHYTIASEWSSFLHSFQPLNRLNIWLFWNRTLCEPDIGKLKCMHAGLSVEWNWDKHSFPEEGSTLKKSLVFSGRNIL